MSRFLASLCTATLALASFSMAFTPAPVFTSVDYYTNGCDGSCTKDINCLSKGGNCPTTEPNCICNKTAGNCNCD